MQLKRKQTQKHVPKETVIAFRELHLKQLVGDQCSLASGMLALSVRKYMETGKTNPGQVARPSNPIQSGLVKLPSVLSTMHANVC